MDKNPKRGYVKGLAETPEGDIRIGGSIHYILFQEPWPDRLLDYISDFKIIEIMESESAYFWKVVRVNRIPRHAWIEEVES